MNHAIQRERSCAPSTHRSSTADAYAKDVRQFTVTYGGSIPCSSAELLKYILLLSKRVAPPTVIRRVMALQDAHVRKGLPSPTADEQIRTALRHLTAGKLPVNLLDAKKQLQVEKAQTVKISKSATPITRPLLMRMLDAMGTGKRSLDRRDKAIFLLGFTAGLKRGTLCSLDLEDLTFTPDVLLLRIGALASPVQHESEDSTAQTPTQSSHRTLAVPFTRGPLCAATACHEWIAHNGLEGQHGPLFPRFTRSGEPVLSERLDSAYISVLVKKRLLDAGESDVSSYSAESLRRGHELENRASRQR